MVSTLASHARGLGFESWAGQFLLLIKYFKIGQKYGDLEVSCAISSLIYLDNTLVLTFLHHFCQKYHCSYYQLKSISRIVGCYW